MRTDFLLAVAHHVLAFALVSALAAELAWLRALQSLQQLQREPHGLEPVLVRLARLDAVYGACAGLLVAVGALRVAFGVKGARYYLANPWFWAKMAAFVAVGALSVAPTMHFVRWRRAAHADAAFEPSARTVARAARLVTTELLLIVVVLACAAAMARYGTL